MAIDNKFFSKNRIELLKRMPENIALVFFAGSEVAQSADCNNRFLVDRDFYYLTGITDSKCSLVIIKEGKKVTTKLYVLPKDDMKERWQGRRKTHDEYAEITGISDSDIKDLDEFEDDIYKLFNESSIQIGFDGNSIGSETKTFFDNAVKNRIASQIIDVKDTLIEMRMVKRPCELNAIKKAAKITETAVKVSLKGIKPGMTEYDLFVRLEYEMAKRGSLIPAFETIVAVDDNSFYLHHNNPDKKVIKAGDVIQLDLGARVDGYCADISRAVFVGTSDDEVKMKHREELHELIVTLRKECWSFIKPGETFVTLNNRMREIVFDWLVNKGLIQMSSDCGEKDVSIVSDYYWHNTSHHLGLDVHDVSKREKPFEAGNALAVEPGVYIKEWGVGFRIEDDVAVTKDGCKLLSSGKDDLEVY